MRIKTYLRQQAKVVDRYLDRYLPPVDRYPPIIHRAVRYSVLNGGKRIRPIIAIEANRACGGRFSDIIPVACALELIHTYSLVHDDLPSMDDDDYRRGKPTVHRRFGEAIAVLTGDALLTLAFHLMGKRRDPLIQQRVIQDVSCAIGTQGMIGGQTMDIVVKKKNPAVLNYIHTHKTGALIAVSAKVGAISAGASPAQTKALSDFGRHIGLSFQIIDDILDQNDYFELYGGRGARLHAERLVKKARNALKPFGGQGAKLGAIADFILERPA